MKKNVDPLRGIIGLLPLFCYNTLTATRNEGAWRRGRGEEEKGEEGKGNLRTGNCELRTVFTLSGSRNPAHLH